MYDLEAQCAATDFENYRNADNKKIMSFQPVYGHDPIFLQQSFSLSLYIYIYIYIYIYTYIYLIVFYTFVKL